MVLAVGEPAPDFSLRNQHGETIALSSFAESRDVLLVFYPFAFSSVCTGELHALRDRFDEVDTGSIEVLAISCDHRYSLRAFADQDGYQFSLLSDFWPHGAVSRAYSAFDEEVGCSSRTSVVIDARGVVRGVIRRDVETPRDIDEYIAVLADLRLVRSSGSSGDSGPRDAG